MMFVWALIAFHLMGIVIGWLGIMTGDLWRGKTYREQAMKLLGWEWWLVLGLTGEGERRRWQ